MAGHTEKRGHGQAGLADGYNHPSCRPTSTTVVFLRSRADRDGRRSVVNRPAFLNPPTSRYWAAEPERERRHPYDRPRCPHARLADPAATAPSDVNPPCRWRCTCRWGSCAAVGTLSGSAGTPLVIAAELLCGVYAGQSAALARLLVGSPSRLCMDGVFGQTPGCVARPRRVRLLRKVIGRRWRAVRRLTALKRPARGLRRAAGSRRRPPRANGAGCRSGDARRCAGASPAWPTRTTRSVRQPSATPTGSGPLDEGSCRVPVTGSVAVAPPIVLGAVSPCALACVRYATYRAWLGSRWDWNAEQRRVVWLSCWRRLTACWSLRPHRAARARDQAVCGS